MAGRSERPCPKHPPSTTNAASWLRCPAPGRHRRSGPRSPGRAGERGDRRRGPRSTRSCWPMCGTASCSRRRTGNGWNPLVRSWSVASAVGHASASEIDALGIIAALRLAGTRAWLEILAAGVTPGRRAARRQPQLALARPPSLPCSTTPGRARLRRAGPHPGQGRHAVPQRGRRQHHRQGGARPADAQLHTRVSRRSAGTTTRATAPPRTRTRLRAAGPTPYHRVSWQTSSAAVARGLSLRRCRARAGARGAPDGARWNHECRGP